MKNSDPQQIISLVNPDFEIIVRKIQANIGKLIVALLILTYVGTALFIAVSLQQSLITFGPVLSWVVAGATALLGQSIRGGLVYFNQANPYRISNRWEYLGLGYAFVMTLFSSFEVHHLFSSNGIGLAAEISCIGLIIFGFFLETYFFGEINRTNRSVMIEDPELVEQVIAYEEKHAEMLIRIKEAKIQLQNHELKRLRGALQQGRKSNNRLSAPTPSEHPEPEVKAAEPETPEPQKNESLFDFAKKIVSNGHEKN